MDNKNNSSDLKNALNNYQEENEQTQMPALSKDVETKSNNIENNSNININDVKSVFEDMNVSTQVSESTEPKKIDNVDNAPIQTPIQDSTQATPNVQIRNEANLSATTIGTVKPDKQKSPIAMIVLFGFLLFFMIFMPEVLDFVNKNFGTNLEAHTGVNIPDTPEEKEQETQKNTMYDFNDDTTILLDKITFQSFVKSIEDNEYKLSFTIRNGGTQLYEFKKKLYFDFYDESSTFIDRTYLESITQITSGMTNTYKVSISKNIYDRAKKIELVQRTIDDYPNVELIEKQLTCTNSKYNLVYTFDDNQRLIAIKDMYTYTKPDDLFQYSSDLLTYKSKIENLDKQDGVTAILTETDTGFFTSTVIDYSLADYTKLSSDTNYYMKDTYARIIKFEMSSKGYNCR